ncbi:MAG: hypothetical protein K0S30_1689 [Clostridia bacterium]|jgi:ribosomal protein S18 acetylase RimI-like enzyme|nr:hypothetical protein [Clostridia bacterium]
MRVNIQPTPWDDQYFNLRTARVTLTQELAVAEQKELIENSKKFDLVVVDNSRCILENDRMLSALKNSYLCDIQVRFKLVPDGILISQPANVSIENSMRPSKEVLDISQTAYRYSRFKVDKFLDQQKSQDIYIKWCEDAFNRPDKYFLVYKKDERIEGYILFHIDEALMIELVAVREDSQGSGIGGKMIKELICFCRQKDIREIRVGTQAHNREAIGFYQKHGFRLQEVRTIYHYWPKK